MSRKLTFAFLLICIAGNLRAQRVVSDNDAAERLARKAQSDFEYWRRDRIPRGYSRASGRCDETIGRWCYWYDDTERTQNDSRQLQSARRDLLHTLGKLRSQFPSNDWITGQYVRYAIEARDDTAALSAARSCRGTPSWCFAVTGLALHSAGEYAAAETAFDSALNRLPIVARCRWTDIAHLLEGELATTYRKSNCDDRATLEKKIWWLADPMYSIPGNDRRTEHLARHVMEAIHRDSRNAVGMRWAEDSREILIRYGWPSFWTLSSSPSSSNLGLPAITEHQRTPGFHFLPAVRHIDSLSTVRSIRFSVAQSKAVERYAPRYARRLIEIETQIARFRRGDSSLVVAAYDMTADTTFAADGIRAAIVIARADNKTPSFMVMPAAGRRGALMLRAGYGESLVGIELISRDSQYVARSRVPVELLPPPVGQVSVSDIILFDTSERLADNLEDAMSRMIGSSRIDSRRKLGLFWEIYNLSAAAGDLPVALTLSRLKSGKMERVLQTLGITDTATPLRVQWTEPAGNTAVAPRSIIIDLSLIPRGRYQLSLTLGSEDKPLAAAERVVDIR